jgi:diguanylate cyclase (GGDEF)-like protein
MKDSHEETLNKDEQVRAAFSSFSSLDLERLEFSESREAELALQERRFRNRRRAVECSICTLLYIFLAVRVFVSTTSAEGPATLRVTAIVPVLLLVNAYLWRGRGAPSTEDKIILSVSCLLGSLETLWQVYHTGNVNQVGLLAVLVFTNTVMRLPFAYALTSFLWSVVAEGVFILYTRWASLPLHVLQPAVIISVGLAILLANYSQSLDARIAYMRYRRTREQVGDLARSNHDLATVAHTDPLTGLANRAALETKLAEIWKRSERGVQVCSFVMADIDHFKTINDRYGHLYGDRVIRRVAHLMSEALRGEDDFIARFGGEEFVVVLPRTTLNSAMRVAERLRGLVELAGLPSLRAGDPNSEGMRATISCGVASGLPTAHADPNAFLDAADEALYRAKRDGRNVVRG